jgi:hypothetical protein
MGGRFRARIPRSGLVRSVLKGRCYTDPYSSLPWSRQVDATRKLVTRLFVGHFALFVGQTLSAACTFRVSAVSAASAASMVSLCGFVVAVW